MGNRGRKGVRKEEGKGILKRARTCLFVWIGRKGRKTRKSRGGKVEVLVVLAEKKGGEVRYKKPYQVNRGS